MIIDAECVSQKETSFVNWITPSDKFLSKHAGMADEVEICAHCSRGRVIRRRQEIDFLQWSDRGVLHCHAIVPIGICDACGAKTWDEIAESIVEETIRKEYEQRRKPEIKP